MAQSMPVAVVTGGNRGLGFEICRQLASKGFHVLLGARDPAKGKAAARQLQGEGLKVDFRKLDVTEPKSIAALAAYLKRGPGRVDVLVNNAAIYLEGGWGRDGEPLLSSLATKPETMRRTFAPNFFGPVLLMQSLAPLMAKRRYGRIVNISSYSGQLATMGGGDLAYRASKTALNAATRILAHDTRKMGILVNAMCPGWVKTDMGGDLADRTAAEAADCAIWLATLKKDGPSGGFFRDRKPFPW